MTTQTTQTLGQKLAALMLEATSSDAPLVRHDEDGNQVCFYTGKPLVEGQIDIDHITPKKLGGIDAAFNLVASSASENRRKNGKHPAFWLLQSDELQAAPDDVLLQYIARLLIHQVVVK